MPYELPDGAFREIERELSEPLFMGVPVGPALNDALVIKLVDGHGDWSRRERWRNRARIVRNRLVPQTASPRANPVLASHILFTWEKSTPRWDELLEPIVSELADLDRAVLFRGPEVAGLLQPGIPALDWKNFADFPAKVWKEEYSRCRPEWENRVKRLVARFDMPKAATEMLNLELLLSSQRIAGCLEALRREAPELIVTEYDRNYLWSCLVLAARQLGIPSVTLQHGVIEQDPIGFSPLLADSIIVWGEFDRDKLVAAGESPERILIGGCPRLTREFSSDPSRSRAKLGLEPGATTILYATSPVAEFIPDVGMFCDAVDAVDGVTGLVRLHPSDSLANYESMRQQHPHVVFSANSAASLDECLAAASLVVVRSSGVGSDALIKKRPTVVLNPNDTLTGHDLDLVEAAGCLHARSAADLVEIIRGVLDHGPSPSGVEKAERYVSRFCSYFGEEAAGRTASLIREVAGKTGGQSPSMREVSSWA